MSDMDIQYDQSDEMEEIWALFAEEGREALDLAEGTLLALETDLTNAQRITELFRAMHTFKGMARMMGMTVTESLSHRAEDLIGLVRDEGVPMTGDMIDLLLAVLDQLRLMLGHVLAHRADADPSEIEGLLARLEVTIEACQSPESESEPSPAEAAGEAGLMEADAAEEQAGISEEEETVSDETLEEAAALDFLSEEQPEAQGHQATADEPSPDHRPEADDDAAGNTFAGQGEVADGPGSEAVAELADPEAPAHLGEEPAETQETEAAEVLLADPATGPVIDHGYLQIFMEMADEETERLQAATDTLDTDPETAISTIQAVADSLGYAAEQMGFKQVASILQELLEAANQPADFSQAYARDRLDQLGQAVAQLHPDMDGQSAGEAAAAEPDVSPAAEETGEQMAGADDRQSSDDFWGMPPNLHEPDEPLANPVVPLPEAGDTAEDNAEQVQAFLDMAHEELGMMHAALAAVFNGDETHLPNIRSAAEKLREASDRLGYARTSAVLNDLANATEQSDRDLLVSSLKKAELALFEELVAVQEFNHMPHVEKAAGRPSFAWLFRQSYAERVFADLACLSETIEAFDKLVDQFLTDGYTLASVEKLADEATYLLRAIYHSCVFYKIYPAAHLTLALGDLYARIFQGEMAANKALFDLTRTYVTHLGQTIEAIQEGQEPDFKAIETLIDHAEQILYFHTGGGRASEISRDILELFDLSDDFKEVITPENLVEIAQAMQAEEDFYTVLVDMNEDETIGQRFYEWTLAEDGRLITNITVYRGNQTLFDFLLATAKPRAEIVAALAEIDPSGQRLTLRPCKLRDDVNLEQALPEHHSGSAGPHSDRTTENRSAVDMESLAEVTESVGKLLTLHATLRRVSDRLSNLEISETVTRLLSQDSQQTVRDRIQKQLDGLTAELHQLGQIETQIGAALAQLHETTMALRVRPVTEIMRPLRRMVEDLAHNQGKKVELDITGADVELDQNVLNILSTPVQRLVWFAVTHSIELPQYRKEAGKGTAGHIALSIKKLEDHVQLVIEDDGRGLSPESIIDRARELGWINGRPPSDKQISEWVLREEFGPVAGSGGSEGLNLAAVQTTLTAHRGDVTVQSNRDKGLRFVINLPLGMVVVDGMVVRAGDVSYVIPVAVVHRIVDPDASSITHASADGDHYLLRLDEDLIPIHRFYQRTNGNSLGKEIMIVVEQNEQTIALAVDELIGQQQVLIQPLQGYLSTLKGVSGCALLGDGEVGMVLSLNQMESAI